MVTNSASEGQGPIRVYRTLPARVIGWGFVAAAVVLTVMTLLDVAGGHREGLLSPVAFIVGIGTIGWVLFLRPKVELYEDRVELTNIVTSTTVPFTVIEEVTHQWSLELHDSSGRRHSAWAVPVRREMTRRRNIDDFAETTRVRGREQMTAQGAADDVLRAIDQWELAGGQRATTSVGRDGTASGGPSGAGSAGGDGAASGGPSSAGSAGGDGAAGGAVTRLSWTAVLVLALATALTLITIAS